MPTPAVDLQEQLSAIARQEHERVDTREATADRVLRNLEAHGQTGEPLSEESQSYLASYRRVVNAATHTDSLAGEPTSQEATEALRAMRRVGRAGSSTSPVQGPLLMPCTGHSFSVGDLIRIGPSGEIVACNNESEASGATGVVSGIRSNAIEISVFSQQPATTSAAAYGRLALRQEQARLRLLRLEERARILDVSGLADPRAILRAVGIDAEEESRQLAEEYARITQASAGGLLRVVAGEAEKTKQTLNGAKPAERTRSRKILRKKKK